MRKIDGLKFLQKNFPDLTVDCLFVDKVENLDEQLNYIKKNFQTVFLENLKRKKL